MPVNQSPGQEATASAEAAVSPPASSPDIISSSRASRPIAPTGPAYAAVVEILAGQALGDGSLHRAIAVAQRRFA